VRHTRCRFAGNGSDFQSVAQRGNGTQVSGHLSRTILVGHSFGALSEKATGAGGLGKSDLGRRNVHSASGLRVLLNLAGESIYAKEMTDMFRRAASCVSEGSGAVRSVRTTPYGLDHIQSRLGDGDDFSYRTGLSNALAYFASTNGTTDTEKAVTMLSQREFSRTRPGTTPGSSVMKQRPSKAREEAQLRRDRRYAPPKC